MVIFAIGDILVIIGFSYKKFLVERTGIATGKINISNNVSVKDIKEQQLSLGGKDKQDSLVFTFEYSCSYQPNIGSIVLTGEVVFLEDPKVIKDIVKDWKKDKKVDHAVMKGILNNILSRCTIQSLILSQELSLPSPIPLPQVTEQIGKK